MEAAPPEGRRHRRRGDLPPQAGHHAGKRALQVQERQRSVATIAGPQQPWRRQGCRGGGRRRVGGWQEEVWGRGYLQAP